ncbi:MAG: tRNA (adenosine(37)-N6)-dimethylallyltransferase MiaA [Nitrospirae bacterium]|nr:tRNA (adenosine(37)-N6)-dimethylallyltransferase MiaA [Nitrospirota bacterium]
MKKILAIIGPTGVGKTETSIMLAQSMGAEIISSDSMQVYKHMDIGTAKPSKEQLSLVKHHMIDIVEPWESYSAGRYIEDVVPVIKALHASGKTPLLTGGTGLYLKAMTRGLFSGPAADWDLREDLMQKEVSQPGVLYEELMKLDKKTASTVERADTKKIVRALEICIKSSSPASELREKETVPLPYEFIKIGLTRQRPELYKIIDQRVEKMIESGLLQEVKNIMSLIENAQPYMPAYTISSMQAIGYKELAQYLSGRLSLDEATNLIKQRSRNYAKRQYTWFKKEDSIQWIDITGIFSAKDICDLINFNVSQK